VEGVLRSTKAKEEENPPVTSQAGRGRDVVRFFRAKLKSFHAYLFFKYQ
jgi:hypothetical protein